MPDVEELLSTVGEMIDEDTAAQLRAIIEQSATNAAAQATTAAAWTASLRSETMFSKYPRVVNALRNGLEDDPANEETLAKMEEKLTKLGVADPRATAAPVGPVAAANPADQWGQPVQAGDSPPPNPDEPVRGAMEKGDLYGVIEGIHKGGRPGSGTYRDVIEPYQDYAPLPYRKRI